MHTNAPTSIGHDGLTFGISEEEWVTWMLLPVFQSRSTRQRVSLTPLNTCILGLVTPVLLQIKEVRYMSNLWYVAESIYDSLE